MHQWSIFFEGLDAERYRDIRLDSNKQPNALANTGKYLHAKLLQGRSNHAKLTPALFSRSGNFRRLLVKLAASAAINGSMKRIVATRVLCSWRTVEARISS